MSRRLRASAPVALLATMVGVLSTGGAGQAAQNTPGAPIGAPAVPFVAPPTPAVADSGPPSADPQAPVALPEAFEQMVQDVPAGSCLHDPQPCGARRVIVQAGVRQPDGSLAFGPGATDPGQVVAAAARKGAKAKAAVQTPQCFLHADKPEIYNEYGNYKARGTGHNQCTGAVVLMETYVTLMDLISTGWRNLDVATDRRANGSVAVTARFDCNHPVSTRSYNTRAEGYASVQGVLYAATDNDWQDHTCP